MSDGKRTHEGKADAQIGITLAEKFLKTIKKIHLAE